MAVYRNAKKLFDRAREKKPSILFIDEVEGMFTKRGSDNCQSNKRTTNQFLVQMNELESGVLVIGATNLPHHLDSAFLRRFQVFIALLKNYSTKTSVF